MATWTDNPATSSTHVRARHINELRGTVDRNRRVANLSPFPWTDNPVTAATHIRATHFTEIRSAIPSSVPIGNWSVGSPPSPSRQVSARDINDLRSWVDQFSQSLGFPSGPDPVPQGVTSFTVDPNSGPNYIMVDQNWINDILQLGTTQTGLLLIRAEVKTDNNNNLPTAAYQTAFGRYSANSLTPYTLLASEFDRQNTGTIGPYDAPLTTTWTNPYITDFVQKAGTFAAQVAQPQSGVSHFIIWNEPNDTGGAYLDANRFAALTHEASAQIKSQVTGARVLMGGLLWPNGGPAPGGGTYTPQSATDAVVQYLGQVYEYLYINNGGIPWDVTNLHIHHCAFGNGDMLYLYNQLIGLRRQYGDTTPIYVGEWGVMHKDATDAYCLASAFSLLNTYFDGMFYFQHPNHVAQYADCCYPGPTPACPANPPAYPNGPGDVFGLVRWSESGGVFSIPDNGRCPEWAMLQDVYQTNPAPQ